MYTHAEIVCHAMQTKRKKKKLKKDKENEWLINTDVMT